MSEQLEKPKKLQNFGDISEFLDKLEGETKEEVYKDLNDKFKESLKNEAELTEIAYQDYKDEFTENDHSLKTFLKRVVYAYIADNAEKLNVNLSGFVKKSDFGYYDTANKGGYRVPTFLDFNTTKAIFDVCNDHLLKSKEKIDCKNMFEYIVKLCRYTVQNELSEKNVIFPLDFIIYLISTYSQYVNVYDSDIKAIFPFIGMSSFLYEREDLSDEDIYKFFDRIPLDCIIMFLENKKFVEALGGIDKLQSLLDINELEEHAQNLARKLRNRAQKIDVVNYNNDDNIIGDIERDKNDNNVDKRIDIIDDEDYKKKVKFQLTIHQFPEYLASVFIFLFGVGLLLSAGFAWSVPFLFGIGFLVSSGAAVVNSLLCMRPTKTTTWLAKIFKNCAWIIDGALLITLGAVFCAGPLAIACIVFGSLGVLMGCFNAFVGTLNSMWDTQRELADPNLADKDQGKGGICEIENIKSEILSHKIFTLVVFAVACVTGILLALNPAILPIALPFLPAVGIGIAALSGLGLIKSALRLFYTDDSQQNSWQVRFHQAAKYIKSGMFVLGGLGLIALPFLPIAAALASVIGMPTLVVNIFSFLVGLVSAVKGCMSFTRMSSNIKFQLANLAIEKAHKVDLPENPIDIEKWTCDLHQAKPEPNLKPGDISDETLEKIFGE